MFAPLLADKCDLSPICHPNNPSLSPPSSQFWFGTDVQGRSVLSLTIWGARVSLVVGLAATLITVVIGTSIGLVAGYYGGWRETGLMRLTDWFLVIPFLPLAIVLAVILKPSLYTVIFVIGITSWPSTARVIRAQVLTLKTRGYVERSRALGRQRLPPRHAPHPAERRTADLREHRPDRGDRDPHRDDAVVPGARPDPSVNISWGTILEQAFGQGAAFAGYWWWIVPPGVAIVLLVLSFTMIGYALDDILNPKLRGR